MKKVLTVAVCVIGIIIGTLSVRAGISSARQKKTDSEYFTEGAKLIAYELREYIETEDNDIFHRAATDVLHLSENSNLDLGSDYNKEVFSDTADAFTYNEGKMRSYAERLAEAFEMIAEDPKDEYPYSQLKIVLNSIS